MLKFCVLFSLLACHVLLGQEKLYEFDRGDNKEITTLKMPKLPGLIGEWYFQPNYSLPWPDGPLDPSYEIKPTIETGSISTSLAGQKPTHRITTDISKIPRLPLSIEFWISYHVNEPVGASIMARDLKSFHEPYWLFGFFKGEAYLHTLDQTYQMPLMRIKSGPPRVPYPFEADRYHSGDHRYWHHVVLNLKPDGAELFHNGDKIEEIDLDLNPFEYARSTKIEFSSFLSKEPFMQLGDLIKYAAIYEGAMSSENIKQTYSYHKELIDHGLHHPNKLHFTTTAPHLAMPTRNSIHIVWETNKPANATVSWGDNINELQSKKIPHNESRVQKVKIEGLKPNSSYIYRVDVSHGGEEISSGNLIFRTAVESGDPVVFAAISDTEARPHVNSRLASLIWRETPHLLLNAGDLTDGGRLENRVEWTHEYFAAMGHFMSRVPVLPVMGNGEDDFVWFDQYHYTPAREVSYYNYIYGDVEFFVLDSNLGKRDREHPGFRERQKKWLKKVLRDSKATWKIAAHHHPVLPERYPLIISDFVELYEEFDVDLVLVGHHHNYRRSWPLKLNKPTTKDGVIYIQLGGGGGNISNRPASPDLRWIKTYQGYGYSMFRILGSSLTYEMYDSSGAMRDFFNIQK